MKRTMIALPFALAATVASAQTTGQTKGGAEIQLGWIGSADKDCRPNPAPSVKPSTLARNGQIRLSSANVRTKKIEGCPETTVPAVVVFYKPKPGFTGEDSFTLDVKSADGKPTPRDYRVTVE